MSPKLAIDIKNYKIHKFIHREVELGATLGPFVDNPLKSFRMISPLNTAEKKDSVDRRVIMDLSCPIGNAVNDGIDKDVDLGELSAVSYPTLDNFLDIVVRLGPACHIFKCGIVRFRFSPGILAF